MNGKQISEKISENLDFGEEPPEDGFKINCFK